MFINPNLFLKTYFKKKKKKKESIVYIFHILAQKYKLFGCKLFQAVQVNC